MVGLDGFSEGTNVNTDHDEILPNLPVFIITLEGFLEGAKGLVSGREKKKRKVKEATVSILQ